MYGRDGEELLSSRPWRRRSIPLPGVVDREGEGDGMEVAAREGNPKLHGRQGVAYMEEEEVRDARLDVRDGVCCCRALSVSLKKPYGGGGTGNDVYRRDRKSVV